MAFDITDEMISHFVSYVNRHRNLVTASALALYEYEFIDDSLASEIANSHDLSKFREPEFTPYVRRKWMEKRYGLNYNEMGDDVKDAIVHHVTYNEHHPEYWSPDYMGFASDKPCHIERMPEDCVIEMICDWNAMGLEFGNTPRQWWEKTKNARWIPDAKTDALIEKWLKNMESVKIDIG